MSEAINIQMPYNLERLLFYLTNQNHEQIRIWYNQLEKGTEKSMCIAESEWFEKLHYMVFAEERRIQGAHILASTIQL
jgi:threonine synthase